MFLSALALLQPLFCFGDNMGNINYYLEEKEVKSNYLIIKNCLDSRRLCKVTIDDKLFKLLLLLPNEVKEIKLSPEFKSKVKVIDITN